MSFQPDIVVYSPDRQLQLVVEVKRMPSSDPQWAAKLHQNLLEHQAVPPSPFFLLVLPDHLYLWSSKHKNGSYLPDYQAQTGSALSRYLPEQSQKRGDISELGLELAVRFWLSELISSNKAPENESELAQWVKESGLYEAIRKGIMQNEAAA